jgi:hypothetical protein
MQRCEAAKRRDEGRGDARRLPAATMFIRAGFGARGMMVNDDADNDDKDA